MILIISIILKLTKPITKEYEKARWPGVYKKSRCRGAEEDIVK